jgi:WD40 repeat protein
LEWWSNENGGFLLSGSSDNTIRMWSIESGECVKVLSGHTDDVFCLKLINTNNTPTSSDRHLVSGSFDGCLRVWNLHTGLCIRTIKTNTPIYKLVFSSFLF